MNFTRNDVLDMTWDEAIWNFEWLKKQRAEESRLIKEAHRRR